MKILLVNTLYAPLKMGGAEKSVQILAEELVREDHEVSVITCSDGTLPEQEIINGVSVYRLEENLFYNPLFSPPLFKGSRFIWDIYDSFNLFLAGKLRSVIRKIRPDIVSTHNIAGIGPIIWHVAGSEKIKITHTLRDYYLICRKWTMYKEEHNCEMLCADCAAVYKLKRHSIKRIDHLIGISEFILKEHIRITNYSGRMSVIYNSIGEDSDLNTSTRRIKVGDPVYGYIGAISEPKGVSKLLEVFSERREHLIIAGKGNAEYVDELKNRFPLSNVTWLGFTPMEKFLQRVDYVIVPSLWNEPFGRVVIEAASAGAKVLVNNTGGLPEVAQLIGNVYTFEDFLVGDRSLSTTISDIDSIAAENSSPLKSENEEIFKDSYMAKKYLEIFSDNKL